MNQPMDLPGLAELRARIDEIDEKILALIGERLDIVHEVGVIKIKHNAPVADAAREAMMLERLCTKAPPNLDDELVKAVFHHLITNAKRLEALRMSEERAKQG